MSKYISLRQVVINKNTNEVVDDIEIRKTLKYETNEEDKFFMVYYNHIGSMFNLRGDSIVKLCMKLMEYVDYNTNTVDIYQARKREICDEIGLSESNWSKYIRMLENKGILKDQGFKRYKVNPLMFWKGDNKSRAVAIEDFSIIYERTPKVTDDNYQLGYTYTKEEEL